MNLFSFGYQPRHESNSPDVTRHRWTYATYATRLCVGAGVEQQVESDGKWRTCGDYFNVALSKSWYLGPRHDYYDGPHCSFWVGPLVLSWSYWWCTKCMPEPAK